MHVQYNLLLCPRKFDCEKLCINKSNKFVIECFHCKLVVAVHFLEAIILTKAWIHVDSKITKDGQIDSLTKCLVVCCSYTCAF